MMSVVIGCSALHDVLFNHSGYMFRVAELASKQIFRDMVRGHAFLGATLNP